MQFKEILRKQAVSSVWGNPKEDGQYLFRAIRLTYGTGSVNSLNSPMVTVGLPNATNFFHVYSITNINLKSLHLDDYALVLNNWTVLSWLNRNGKCAILAFIDYRMLMLDKVYIRQLTNGELLIAVRQDSVDYLHNKGGDLHIRFYRFQDGLATTHRYSSIAKATNSVGNWTSFKNTMGVTPSTMYYIDGYLVNVEDISWNLLPVNTVVQAMVDGSITDSDRHDMNVDLIEAPTYYSSSDGSQKVIVSAGESLDRQYYFDDIEFFLKVKLTPTGNYKYVYLPHMDNKAIRKLTYNEWAMDTRLINDILDTLGLQYGGNVTAHGFRIYARKSKRWYYPLLDGNYIKDLERIPANLRLEALTGVNASIPIWAGGLIEASAYHKWRDLPLRNLDLTNLNDVFSRHGAITALERIMRIDNRWAFPTTAMANGGYIFSFLPDGRRPGESGLPSEITNWDNQFMVVSSTALAYKTVDYVPTGFELTGMELFNPTRFNNGPMDTFVMEGITSPSVFQDYQGLLVYYYGPDGGLFTAEFGKHYTLSPSPGDRVVLNWVNDGSANDITNFRRIVRRSGRWYRFKRSISLTDITDGIPLYDSADAAAYGIEFDIGFQTLNVWYNGRYMVEGIDYMLYKPFKDNPEVLDTKIMLMCKRPWETDDNHCIEVLAGGIGNRDLTGVKPSKTGFIRHGQLFYNEFYDLVLDRNNWIFAAGHLIWSPALHAENPVNGTINQMIDLNQYNGYPYAVVKMPQIASDDELDASNLVASKDIAEQLDKQIENYLSFIYEQEDDGLPDVVVSNYDLYSIVIDKMVEDMLNNVIDIHYDVPSDELIDEIVNTRYHEYKLIDAAYRNVGNNLVDIRPRFKTIMTGLTSLNINFLKAVNDRHLNGRVTGWSEYFTVV